MFLGNKLSEVEKAIAHADNYQTFYEACQRHDELSGANDWKEKDRSNDYDYQLIQKRIIRLQKALDKRDAPTLMQILHEGIHGNLGNLANPELGRHSKVGTKKLIETFLDLVCKALKFIYNADEQQVDFYEKLSFFDETSHAFGQSCLMLSGGAGLGFFHAGVVLSLLEHDLIPSVVSGASSGSIIAALVGTRTKSELVEILSIENIYQQFGRWRRFKGVNKDELFDSTNLENALIELFDLTTFEEAYQKTGIDMTVTVSPADLHQISRLLNAKTSPNALIVQAVRASCAIPYVFSPVYLKAKDQQGNVIPYIPNRKFADGSLMADLPFERLARIYGVNHSIVSQTNPLATPFLSGSKNKSNGLTGLTLRHIANMAKKNSIYLCDLLETVAPTNSFKLGIHKVRSVIDQQYVGNINILPKGKLANYKYLLANPSKDSLAQLLRNAEQATWPRIDEIKRSTKISKTFQKYLKKLKQKEADLLKVQSYPLDAKKVG